MLVGDVGEGKLHRGQSCPEELEQGKRVTSRRGEQEDKWFRSESACVI